MTEQKNKLAEYQEKKDKINDKTPEEIEKELEGFILKKQLYDDFMDKISKIQEEVA